MLFRKPISSRLYAALLPPNATEFAAETHARVLSGAISWFTFLRDEVVKLRLITPSGGLRLLEAQKPLLSCTLGSTLARVRSKATLIAHSQNNAPGARGWESLAIREHGCTAA